MKRVNDFQSLIIFKKTSNPLIIITKFSILDLCRGPASILHRRLSIWVEPIEFYYVTRKFKLRFSLNILTFLILILEKEKKTNLNLYFHTSLWCLKRYCKEVWIQKLSWFLFWSDFLKHTWQGGLTLIISCKIGMSRHLIKYGNPNMTKPTIWIN